MLTHNVTSHWHKMMCAYIYRHVQYLICSVNKLITADFTCWLNPIINWVAAASSKGQNSKYLWKSSAPNSRWKNLKWLMNKLWVDYDTIFTESVCVCEQRLAYVSYWLHSCRSVCCITRCLSFSSSMRSITLERQTTCTGIQTTCKLVRSGWNFLWLKQQHCPVFWGDVTIKVHYFCMMGSHEKQLITHITVF